VKQKLQNMGNGMNKIYPGLYVGSIRDSQDAKQLEDNGITHIVSIHDAASQGNHNVKYLCIQASDYAQQDIKQYFSQTNHFIHEARVNGGNVLVHCLAGVSRSTSICIAYIMTVSDLTWIEAMNAVKASRKQCNPNYGFQRQLQNYENTSLVQEREALVEKFGAPNMEDVKHARDNLELYNESITNDTSKHSNTFRFKAEKAYPLPFNAYNLDDEKKVKKAEEAKEEIVAKDEPQKSQVEAVKQPETEAYTNDENAIEIFFA